MSPWPRYQNRLSLLFLLTTLHWTLTEPPSVIFPSTGMTLITTAAWQSKPVKNLNFQCMTYKNSWYYLIVKSLLIEQPLLNVTMPKSNWHHAGKTIKGNKTTKGTGSKTAYMTGYSSLQSKSLGHDTVMATFWLPTSGGSWYSVRGGNLVFFPASHFYFFDLEVIKVCSQIG